MFALIGGGIATASWLALRRPEKRPVPGRIRNVLQCFVFAVASILAFSGLAALLGALILLLVLLLVAGSPWFVGLVRPHRDRDTERLPGWPQQPLKKLSTTDLIAVWRSSGDLLAAAQSPADRALLVNRRAECLDELERRDPEGFAAWICLALDPAVDPDPFVRRRPPSKPHDPRG